MFKHKYAVKKAIAVLLSIVTAMSLMTVPAFAAEDVTEPVVVSAK